MGVTGLWQLLEPVGRRVNIEALTNKRLAVGECHPGATTSGGVTSAAAADSVYMFPTDASIWIQQFIKAMRNTEGDLVRNAHLKGFFSRICKCVFAVVPAAGHLFRASGRIRHLSGCIQPYMPVSNPQPLHVCNISQTERLLADFQAIVPPCATGVCV